jgi:very-short-patch-repair endonuclease
MRDIDDNGRRVAALAGRQHGVVTRAQLLAQGFSTTKIGRWLANGRLVALHTGVYAVGHAALSQRGRWFAATVASGPRAVLSHGSAAALWELRGSQPQLIHVTVPGTGGHDAPRGVRLHRYRSLNPSADVTVRDGIPVTTVERTLLDLTLVLALRKVRRAFGQADTFRILDFAEVDRLVAAHPHRRGTRALAAIAAEHRPDQPLSRSDFEDRLAELCVRHGLPAPRHNLHIAGIEVDLSWPEHRVVAEADSFAFHGTWAAGQRDRDRDARLAAAGYTTHRFTDAQVDREPELVIAALRRSLSDSTRIPGRPRQRPLDASAPRSSLSDSTRMPGRPRQRPL